jgi:DNA replication ATP-dependent helicase Dna2
VQRVEQAKNELRGLIQARNTLANFTSLRSSHSAPPVTPPAIPVKSTTEYLESDDALWAEFEEEALTTQSAQEITLPEPLDEFKTCRRCYQADACMLYRKAVEPHPLPTSAEESGLLDLYENKTSHLSSRHLHFFRKWERLVSLEERELVRYRKEIWTISAAERQDLGR